MDKPASLAVHKATYSKAAHRQALRRLSYPEKVQVVIQLQRIAAPILRTRGRKVRVWPEH